MTNWRVLQKLGNPHGSSASLVLSSVIVPMNPGRLTSGNVCNFFLRNVAVVDNYAKDGGPGAV